MPPSQHRKAITHLKQADPKLAAVIERVGPCRFEPRADGAHFDHIARAIVYQQLSGKAAGTIFARFTALYGDRVPAPLELLATADDALRAVGLSRQKIGYLRSLAETVEQGALAIDRLHELPDDEILASLVRVKGIGRWTAQMFLMFRLGRPDVLPELDLGIQKAIQRAYNLRTLPSPDRVKRIGARWSPYSTVASWYLWRSLE
jgi:DNA-3-methyladenine glycosylase II